MKTLIYILCIITSLTAYAEEFRFQADYKNLLAETNSYEDEVIEVGSTKITRKKLSEYAGINQTEINCDLNKDTTFLQNEVFQQSVNISLVAAVLHTYFQAESDKKKHFLAGALIAAGTTKLCEKIIDGGKDSVVCALSGAGAALIAGLLKEAYDSTGRGNVDAMDAVYTFVPGALVSFRLSF